MSLDSQDCWKIMERVPIMTFLSSFSTLATSLGSLHLCTFRWSSKSQAQDWLGVHLYPQSSLLTPGSGDWRQAKEGTICLCFVYVPICEVTNFVEQQTNVVSDSYFALDFFKKPFLSFSAGQLELQLSFGHINFLPTGVNSLTEVPSCNLLISDISSPYTLLFPLNSRRSLLRQARLLPRLLGFWLDLLLSSQRMLVNLLKNTI